MIRLTHNDLRIQQHLVALPNLPADAPPCRIVQLSDLHFYEYTDPAYDQRVLESVRQLRPDIIVLTGDYVHYGDRYLSLAQNFFGQLEAPLGLFAVLGNHDYKDGHRSAGVRRILAESGITLLVNQSQAVTVPGWEHPLWLAGLDDYYCGRPDVPVACQDVPEDRAGLIMLAHNPLLFDAVARQAPTQVDVVLSGHTHAGHVYIPPLYLIYRYVLKLKYRYGWHRKGDTRLYVTSGVGSAAFYLFKKSLQLGLPRFRWNTTPEVVSLDLVPLRTVQDAGLMAQRTQPALRPD